MYMITDDRYKKFFNSIYNYYCSSVHDIQQFDFENIYTCNSIAEELKIFGIYNLDFNPQGVTILSTDDYEKFIVIIKVSNLYNFKDIEIIMHELTHIYDFLQFLNKCNNGDITNFIDEPLFGVYELYSEFHAFSHDELDAVEYLIKSFSINNLDSVFNNQYELVNNFLNHKKLKLLEYKFNSYDLFQILGKFYLLDTYNHIPTIHQSCIYQYLPKLFHLNKQYLIYKLYKILWNAMDQDNIFDYLSEIDELVKRIL